MRFEVFEKIINNMKKCSDTDHTLYKLGVDLTSVVDEYNKTISLLFKAYYSEEGANWIDWFLYEKFMNDPPLEAHDCEGNEICRDLEDLWYLVEDIRSSISFKEYELKAPLTEEERMNIIKDLLK